MFKPHLIDDSNDAPKQPGASSGYNQICTFCFPWSCRLWNGCSASPAIAIAICAPLDAFLEDRLNLFSRVRFFIVTDRSLCIAVSYRGKSADRSPVNPVHIGSLRTEPEIDFATEDELI